MGCKHYMTDCMRCGYIMSECSCTDVFKIIDYDWDLCLSCQEKENLDDNEG